MTDESTESTAPVHVQTTSRSHKDPPPWMAQAVVILTAWKSWGLVDQLRGLHWERPSRHFEAVDLVLVLHLMALSNARTVRAFFRQLGPHGAVLAALWGRRKLPTRSGFMTLLKAVDVPLVQAVHPLFCPTWSRAFRPTGCGG